MVDLTLLYSLASFSLIIIGTYLFSRILNSVLIRVLKHGSPLVAGHIRRLVWIFVWVMGLMLGVEQLGLRIDILLLMVGLAGIAAIVAFKDTLQNFASRYFSDVYVPFKK